LNWCRGIHDINHDGNTSALVGSVHISVIIPNVMKVTMNITGGGLYYIRVILLTKVGEVLSETS
jgi:hypothetical protein